MNSRGKGKSIATSDQLARDVSNVSIDPQEGDGWEVISKKNKNRSGPGSSGGKQTPQSGSSYPTPGRTAWARPDVVQLKQASGSNGSGRGYGLYGNPWPVTPDPRKPASRGNPRPYAPAPPAVVAPPLAHGWQWAARPRPAGTTPSPILAQDEPIGGDGSDRDPIPEEVSDEDEDVLVDDDSDDDLSDDYDSDVSRKSFGTRKSNGWFKSFFEALDKLTVDEINEQMRQWHCPACHNGPGAIEWYKGLQPLMTHAKTKGATRVKLHRELASLLEEELRRRGTSVIPAGEQYGQWKGLREITTDYEIVWPPMVVIMNTQFEKDENDKWIGMGNQELLEYFSEYAAKKARHAYGPQGHRGMSILIFDSTAVGYMEAERLHKHFTDQGKDRDAWDRRRVLYSAGGKRQLYGYLAHKEDLEAFNYHCQGKSRLKYEMRSYQEMVVGQMRQMSEDNQQLAWLQRKVVKQEQRSKALEETFGVVSQRLRESIKENKIVRERTLQHHQENKQEMDYQEQFFKEQIDKVHKATEEKERIFEKLLQEERAKARQSAVDSGTTEDSKLRKEEIERFIDSQVKGVEEFESEREELIKKHEAKKMELRREYLTKEVELEQEFDSSLTALMEKYKPSAFNPLPPSNN